MAEKARLEMTIIITQIAIMRARIKTFRIPSYLQLCSQNTTLDEITVLFNDIFVFLETLDLIFK